MNPDTQAYASLRRALLGNACFSGLSGALLLFSPHIPMAWLGAGDAGLLRVIGAGLILFSFDLLHQAKRPRVAAWRALIASMADFGWVAASALLLLLAGGELSALGRWLVALVALVVLCFGVWQLSGIRAATRLRERPGHRHCVPVVVNVRADRLWPILADLGGIQRFMPALKSSRLLDESARGVGAVRACEDVSGRRWAEECVAFAEGEGFTLHFLTDAPDFPFPVRAMTGGWQLTPLNGNQCEVTVWWELELKQDFLAPLLLPLMGFQADRDFPKAIARMAREAASGTGGRASASTPAARLALLPC